MLRPYQEDLVRVGLRAKLEGDEELVDAVLNHCGNRLWADIDEWVRQWATDELGSDVDTDESDAEDEV